MKTITYNENNIKDNEINQVVLRARALIINSKNEILLGYLGNTYQFPGGHVEEGETLSDALYREVLEETGITIEKKEYTPFFQIKYYFKNYENSSMNRYVEFNYYLLYMDKEYNLEKRKLDQYEIDNNYELRYVKLNELFNTLDKTVNDNARNPKIYKDVRNVMKYYFEKYK